MTKSHKKICTNLKINITNFFKRILYVIYSVETDLAKVLYESGKVRIQYHDKRNFFIAYDKYMKSCLIFSIKEVEIFHENLIDKLLIFYSKELTGQNLYNKVESIIKHAENELIHQKTIRNDPITEYKICAIIVNFNAFKVIKRILKEDVTVIITYDDDTSKLSRQICNQTSQTNIGFCTVNPSNNIIVVSTAGDPLANKASLKTLQRLSAHEFGHYSDTTLNSLNLITNGYSANYNCRVPNKEFMEALNMDISNFANINYIYKLLIIWCRKRKIYKFNNLLANNFFLYFLYLYLNIVYSWRKKRLSNLITYIKIFPNFFSTKFYSMDFLNICDGLISDIEETINPNVKHYLTNNKTDNISFYQCVEVAANIPELIILRGMNKVKHIIPNLAKFYITNILNKQF